MNLSTYIRINTVNSEIPYLQNVRFVYYLNRKAVCYLQDIELRIELRVGEAQFRLILQRI